MVWCDLRVVPFSRDDLQRFRRYRNMAAAGKFQQFDDGRSPITEGRSSLQFSSNL